MQRDEWGGAGSYDHDRYIENDTDVSDKRFVKGTVKDLLKGFKAFKNFVNQLKSNNKPDDVQNFKNTHDKKFK